VLISIDQPIWLILKDEIHYKVDWLVEIKAEELNFQNICRLSNFM